MLDRLKEILKIQSYSYKQWRMFAFLVRKLKSMPGVTMYVKEGNIYATKGTAFLYPCVVAHMDTVHQITSDLSILQVGDKLTGFNCKTMTQVGIGGDDKVGIYIALEALMAFDNIKVAFFRDEEVGCVGSELADMKFFNDCSFVLQCDRRGNDDFIVEAGMVELSGKAFQEAIGMTLLEHGYKFERGMMTDVQYLKEQGLAVAAANISCGYYNPHCPNEYVSVKDVDNCLSLVLTIIDRFGSTVFPHEFKYEPVFKRIEQKKPNALGGKEKGTDTGGRETRWWEDETNDVTGDDEDDKNAIFEGECDSCMDWSILAYNQEYCNYMCSRCTADATDTQRQVLEELAF